MPYFSSNNQVRDSRSAAKFRHGSCSKAQMCLHKILHIITSVTSLETEIEGKGLFGDENGAGNWFCPSRGFGIDLNLRLGPLFPEVEAPESSATENGGGLSACSGTVGKAAETGSTAVSVGGGVAAVEKSSEAECEAKEGGGEYGRDSVAIEANRNGEESEVAEERRTELESEITNLEAPSFKIGENGGELAAEVAEESMIEATEKERDGHGGGEENKKTKSFWRDNGHLGLLVEAAKLISGNFGENEESEAESDSDTKPELGGESGTRKKTVIVKDSKKRKNWMVEYYGEVEEDVSPVVRSKRGRSQVLPYRYRDSVLEPWNRLARPQRSAKVSAKRRSR